MHNNLGIKHKGKVEELPQQSYVEEDLCANSNSSEGEACLMLKVQEQRKILYNFLSLPAKLRQYLTAVMEVINVVMALLLELDPDVAAHTLCCFFG